MQILALSGSGADGQGKNHQTTAAVGVADIHLSLVTGDDLVADREADAGAAVLGAAFIEFFLYVGELCLGNSASVVPEEDLHISTVAFQTNIDDFTVATVNHRVIQQIQKNLLQAL